VFIILAFYFLVVWLISCNNGTTNNDNNIIENPYIEPTVKIQGKFLLNTEVINFYVENSNIKENNKNVNSAFSLIGKLEHNSHIIKLSGFFIPNERVYSISAGRNNFRYAINGKFNDDFSIKETNATIQEKNETTWISIENIPISFEAVNINGTIEEDYENVIKQQFLGKWINTNHNLQPVINSGVITTFKKYTSYMLITENSGFEYSFLQFENNYSNVNLAEIQAMVGFPMTKEEVIIAEMNKYNSLSGYTITRNGDILIISYVLNEYFYHQEINIIDENTISTSNNLQSNILLKIVNGKLEMTYTILGLELEPIIITETWNRP